MLTTANFIHPFPCAHFTFTSSSQVFLALLSGLHFTYLFGIHYLLPLLEED